MRAAFQQRLGSTGAQTNMGDNRRRSTTTMTKDPELDLVAWAEVPDEEIVYRVRGGEVALYEILMRRYNQRLYRVARSILRNDTEAEDVMQDAYVRAYTHLNQFAGEAQFSTWLTKIAVYEALARLRAHGRTENLDLVEKTKTQVMSNISNMTRDPETQAYDEELRMVMEHAISELPATYRSVFVLRAVQSMQQT